MALDAQLAASNSEALTESPEVVSIEGIDTQSSHNRVANLLETNQTVPSYDEALQIFGINELENQYADTTTSTVNNGNVNTVIAGGGVLAATTIMTDETTVNRRRFGRRALAALGAFGVAATASSSAEAGDYVESFTVEHDNAYYKSLLANEKVRAMTMRDNETIAKYKRVIARAFSGRKSQQEFFQRDNIKGESKISVGAVLEAALRVDKKKQLAVDSNHNGGMDPDELPSLTEAQAKEMGLYSGDLNTLRGKPTDLPLIGDPNVLSNYFKVKIGQKEYYFLYKYDLRKIDNLGETILSAKEYGENDSTVKELLASNIPNRLK